MAAELKLFKTERASLKRTLTRVNNQLMSTEFSSFDLTVRLDLIKENFNALKEVQNKIYNVIDEASIEEEEEYIIECEQTYFNAVALINESLKNLYKTRDPGESDYENDSERGERSDRYMNNPTVSVKLPDIKLPDFKGEYEEWMTYRDLFIALIDENESLSNIQKFHYLRGTLSGEALGVIKQIQLTSENYKTAWQRLLDRYNNSRVMIEKYISQLFSLPSAQKGTFKDLRNLLDTTVLCVDALGKLNQPVNHWDMILVHQVSQKLSNQLRLQWESQIKVNQLPTWQELHDFLNNKCRVLETLDCESKNRVLVSDSIPKNKSSISTVRNQVFTVTNNQHSCVLCKGPHYVQRCELFIRMSPIERSNKTRELKLCFNCLREGHNSLQCKSNYKCNSCKKSHHSMLHFQNSSSNGNQQKEHNNTCNISIESDNIVMSTFDRNVIEPEQCEKKQILLSTACVLVKDIRGEFIKCRVLLDSASQSNFITTDMVSKLGLKRDEVVNQFVCGINQTSTKIKHKIKTIVESRINKYSVGLDFLVVPRISGNLPLYNTSLVSIPNNIILADPQFGQSNCIDMLLGAEIFFDVMKSGKIKLSENSPTFQETLFGWIASGKVGSKNIIKQSMCHFNLDVSESLNDQVKRFWELETLEPKKFLSNEEQQCEELFISSVQRDNNGTYSVSLPLKNNIILGHSKQGALKRFLYLEKKLRADLNLKKDYVEFMQEYLSLGHMELVHDIDDLQTVYYLPHHAVLKPSSVSTKCRVVFDASAKTTSGTSLNDVLLTGPKVQDDLMNIIMRFRLNKYVLVADVEKMYRQISVNKKHRNLQTILWRENESDHIQQYQLTTVTYGTCCAPYLATRALKQLAMDEQDNFPLASSAVLTDCYMDDILTGNDDFEKAKILQKQLVSLFKSGNMKLKKWSSNNKMLLEDIDPSDKLNFNEINKNEITSVIKTLGLSWNPIRDVFKLSVNICNPINKLTKRSMLSAIASLFDPLGLIGPVVTRAKLIMQMLWQLKLDWDNEVPIDLACLWNEFCCDLKNIKEFELKRYIKPASISYELHGYADASEKAYGACIYLRCKINEDCYEMNLVCAKSRVAPLKQISIPKLELCAALLLSQLLSKVKDSLKLKIDNIYLWSDSEVVLKWINLSPHLLKTFVANRVANIQEQTTSCKWLHISTKNNPADFISRGLSASDLINCEMWWKGPAFMCKPQCEWSVKEINIDDKNIPEQKQISVVFMNENNEISSLLEKFSSFQKLKRVVAYICRFIENSKKNKQCKNSEHLKVNELRNAEILIIKLIQKQEFSDEINWLRVKNNVSKKSKILSLNPFLDENGIIRVGGRLEYSKMSFDKKHQIILPKHSVTKLIIKAYHTENLHTGQQGLLNALRQKFWPISAKSMIKGVLKKCVCFRVHPKMINQIMGSLPANRVQQFAPFINSGVDYCGPVYLKSYNKRSKVLNKAYICIFVCFATKAVHIELVGDMTTDSYIGALKCFIARRGKCENIYSDNGSNFIGAKNELTELYRLFHENQHKQKIHDMCVNDNIEFHFIPPRAPHFGGLWEAAVKSLKYHLRRIVGNAHLTFEQMKTVLCQIEAVLNSRPLRPASSDPIDLTVLTPGHFLVGRPLTAIVETNLSEITFNRLSQWQIVQKDGKNGLRNI